MQKLNVDEVRNYTISHTMKECAEHFSRSVRMMRSYCLYHNISAKHGYQIMTKIVKKTRIKRKKFLTLQYKFVII